MKILHKILVLGIFLLIGFNGFGQTNQYVPKQPVSILNESVSASLVIEFHFPEPKDIDLVIYDLDENIVNKTSWKDIKSTFQKLDFSEYKNGIYFIRFYSQSNLISEKKISKV